MQTHNKLGSESLWFSGLLPILYPEFYERLSIVLERHRINYHLLPKTKDIWARDYMPIQIGVNDFIQFVYDPDYLMPLEYRCLKSDPDEVCVGLNVKRKKSGLIVDGGNVIRTSNKVLMCEKVFKENPGFSRNEVVKQLEDLFETEQIIFVPWDKHDYTGHADGMVRFVDDDTVIINEPTNENPHFEKQLRSCLKDTGLAIIEIPYTAPNDPTFISAKGLHLNYLQMNMDVIVPVFNQATDEKALRILENVYKGKRVTTIDCNEIAAEGGVLNCISWNIFV